MKNIFFSIALFSFILFSFDGCQKKENKNTESIKKTTKVDLKIGILPTWDCLPYWIAQACHIYDSLGVKIQIKQYNSSIDCSQALKSKEIDAGYLDLFHAITMHQEKPQYCILAGFKGAERLIVGRSIRLHKIRQIQLRTVGIARFSTADYLCDEIAEQEHINKEDIFRPQINDVLLRKKMLESNQIEAAILPQPEALDMIIKGHKSIYSTSSKKCFATLLTTQSEYNQKKELLLKINQGYIRALKIIGQNKQIADSILLNNYHIEKQTIDSISKWKHDFPQQIGYPDLEIAKKWLETRSKWVSNKKGFPYLPY